MLDQPKLSVFYNINEMYKCCNVYAGFCNYCLNGLALHVWQDILLNIQYILHYNDMSWKFSVIVSIHCNLLLVAVLGTCI